MKALSIGLFLALMFAARAETLAPSSAVFSAAPSKTTSKPWYETLSLRGYSQIRYSGLLETNANLSCEQCDKSWGGSGGFSLRRARLILSGDIHPRVYFYFQPDFASATVSGLNFAQMRDVYADISLDEEKEMRVRIGLSKVPFGYENLQSSSNRLALDRNDALNSAVWNERDFGAFFYWAPTEIRKRFKHLVDSGLKGTGDYGVFGIGAYTGQTANQPEANTDRHVVARLTYPFELPSGQFFEASVQAYTGLFSLLRSTTGVSSQALYRDRRAGVSVAWYPQPIGFQGEYNLGEGPAYDPGSNQVRLTSLEGGYAQVMYRMELGDQILFPFARGTYYRGGKKHELDARRYDLKELDLGLEWQPWPAFELALQYTVSERRFEDAAKPTNRQTGQLLRIQAQINY